MHTFIGSKLVTAIPMTQGHFTSYLGSEFAGYEAPNTPGFLIEDFLGTSNHADHVGQISWMPALNFAAEYLDLGDIRHEPAHVQRMLGELTQLEHKLVALKKFINSDLFLKQSFNERELLQEQCRIMSRYTAILEERINALI